MGRLMNRDVKALEARGKALEEWIIQYRIRCARRKCVVQ